MIKWEERYSTGDESVDRQHRFLFEMFNDFEATILEGRGRSYLETSFPLLEAYAQAHFKFEEDCMDRHQSSVARENKEQHRVFVAQVEKFKKELHSVQFDDGLIIKVHHFLEKWIIEHIIGVDTRLKFSIKK